MTVLKWAIVREPLENHDLIKKHKENAHKLPEAYQATFASLNSSPNRPTL